ncbi:GIY-YIG nuclease family protein [Enterovibrio nigricans]|uniref:T5orf172 domain-containing protein n=1 Tax=Enterovibrio nigricans DSM 22720 TaxID=1121868 RepID=A0A1T4VVW6_9GAMM|nr:GIY-YIG nuclease family protein [Enterovibrio nigricans]PKF49297.1 hypothetical protein AT251_19865 [Enterovibrio nigricans]SKA69097.1 T5orf172 domain-containing protein [Enterovibrio nigricans DSM 22720]
MAFVYLITEEAFEGEVVRPWVKIGYSKNPPEWRVNANLKRGNPRCLVLSAVFEFESIVQARRAEKAAHEQFSQHLFQKEWFQVCWKTVAAWYEEQGAIYRKNT